MIKYKLHTFARPIFYRYLYMRLLLLNAVRNANGVVSKTLYDMNGNVIERIDAKGNSGVNTYDKLNRLVKTVNPEGVVTEFTLSESGRLLLQSTRYFDPDHSPQEWYSYQRTFYANNGRVEARSLPCETDYGVDPGDWEYENKLASKYTYDNNGNALTVEDCYGEITTNTYDYLYRLETTTLPDIASPTAGMVRTIYKNVYRIEGQVKY